jgi:hypothetical protein
MKYKDRLTAHSSFINHKLLSFLQASTTTHNNIPLKVIVAMRLLFLLLFCAQSLVSIFASSPHSDIWSRGSSMARYIVTPANPTNTTTTENMLKSMFGEANIVTSRRQDEITFWAITSSSEEIIASSIRALEGVRQVERQDLASRAEAVSTDVGRYAAQPKESADDEKTGDFLKSKIQPGTLMVTVAQQDGEVMVWYNVVLSPEAKEEVEKYEGIERLIPLPNVAPGSASATNDHPQPEAKRTDIVARDTQRYGALAADNTNVTETEAYLRSKVKNPEHMHHYSWAGVVHGWYNLELDAETKKEVEAHEGIKTMRIPKTLADFIAAPATYWSQRRAPTADDEDRKLIRRADTWDLQKGADKALVMDSQYR